MKAISTRSLLLWSAFGTQLVLKLKIKIKVNIIMEIKF
jgi:hypothetical protein